jgi:hypothetical protein
MTMTFALTPSGELWHGQRHHERGHWSGRPQNRQDRYGSADDPNEFYHFHYGFRSGL